MGRGERQNDSGVVVAVAQSSGKQVAFERIERLRLHCGLCIGDSLGGRANGAGRLGRSPRRDERSVRYIVNFYKIRK